MTFLEAKLVDTPEMLLNFRTLLYKRSLSSPWCQWEVAFRRYISLKLILARCCERHVHSFRATKRQA